jgi:cation transport ATPase
MSVPVAFYEAAAQVIPVLLLTEGVRAGLLLRNVRDVRTIEDENEESNEQMRSLEASIEGLRESRSEIVTWAATSPTTEEQREKLKDLLDRAAEAERDLAVQQAKRADLDRRAAAISSRARKLETRTVVFVALTVALEAVGVLVALLVIANPDMRGYWTFGLAYAALCLGVAGVMEQLFHPLAIDNPKGRAQVWVNRAMRWLICVPLVALPAGYALVVW